MRLIDGDRLKALIIHRRKEAKTLTGIDMVMVIDDAKTVDAVPVVHGKWIFGETLGHSWMKCSCCCKSQFGQTLTFSYCPNCGARMDLEEQDAKKET